MAVPPSPKAHDQPTTEPSGSVEPLPSKEQSRPVQLACAEATGAASDAVPGPRKTARARQSTPPTDGLETTVGVPVTVAGPETVPGVKASFSSAPVELSTIHSEPLPRKAPLIAGRLTPGTA